jgi:dienelactone hydrolase
MKFAAVPQVAPRLRGGGLVRVFGPVFAAAALFLIAAGCAHPGRAGRDPVRVAVFQCDVTPPIGHPLCGGWIKPLEAVDDPLYAKGVVLEQGRERCVVCVLDWCLLQTTAHDLFRRKLAEAAGVPVDHVSVHTVHQHNAPIADIRAQELLAATPGGPPHLDLGFMTNATDRTAAALKASLGSMKTVTQAGFGRAQVEKYASNRRVRLADGVVHVRYSATKDPVLQEAAEGLIDPWMRTVTLANGTKPIVRMHFYASHPMSYYGDGRATSDTAGLARARMEAEEGVPQLYFNGCAGNITAGKYNDGSPAARKTLTDRLHDAMQRSAATTRWMPADTLRWTFTQAPFGPRTEPEWSEATARKNLSDTRGSKVQRIGAALDLAWIERWKKNPNVQVSLLKVGEVGIALLPGESFIEYQLYAHALRPGAPLAVAAYGESGPGYICCDEALHEGGYEPTFSRVGPPTEWRLKEAICMLLGGPDPIPAHPEYPDKLHLLVVRDRDGIERPIRAPAEWKRRRADILAAFQRVAGPLPRADTAAPVAEVLEETPVEGFVRRKVLLQVAPGNAVRGWLFVPKGGGGKSPAMLCLHQTTPTGADEPAGLAGDSNLHYALELARRGYVTFAPDYPRFGENKNDPYAAGFVSATMQGVVNHRRAVDYLASLPEVDPGRIGVIGHSLGGHNAIFLAMCDPRVRAVVTSCGFNSFYKYYGGNLKGWSHPGYMPRIREEFHCDPKEMPFDFTELLAALAPRPVFVNAPIHDANFELSGVKDCLAAAGPVYALLGARDALTAVHPDAGHGFPPEAREAAYAWLDRAMGLTRTPTAANR